MILAFVGGCMFALAWATQQAAVPPPTELVEPPRSPAAQVAVVLVVSDGGPVGSAIDRASGGLGFSHVYIDAGHADVVLDYQPGAGVHWGPRSRYEGRTVARVELGAKVGEQLYGCARSRLGQPFDVPGLLFKTASMANCCGLVVGCLPPKVLEDLGGSGRPIAPNDLAVLFGAKRGATVRWEGI